MRVKKTTGFYLILILFFVFLFFQYCFSFFFSIFILPLFITEGGKCIARHFDEYTRWFDGQKLCFETNDKCVSSHLSTILKIRYSYLSNI